MRSGDSYEEKAVGLFEFVMSDALESQVTEMLATWDADDIRALSITVQHLYKVLWDAWADQVTQPNLMQE